MLSFPLHRNDSVWQGFPDIACHNNVLYVVYRQSDYHKPVGLTHLFLTTSSDFGSSWSSPRLLLESVDRINCPRLFVHNDHVYAVVDIVDACDPYDFGKFENDSTKTKVVIISVSDGHLSSTNIKGILPNKVHALPDGRLITLTHSQHVLTKRLFVTLWMTDDLMGVWRPSLLVSDALRDQCEGSLLVWEDRLLCFLRTHTSGLNPGFFVESPITSGCGLVWSGLKVSGLYNSHRPTAGVLKSGHLLVTYRMSPSRNRGYWARSTFASLLKADRNVNGDVVLFDHLFRELDYDSSVFCDSGYTGWVEVGNEVFAVNYLTGEAPLPYIKVYKFNSVKWFGLL